jgi:hypothetical protein
MDLNLEYNSEQESPSLLDEFKDFLVELWDMIKQDFRNSINFISSNRDFFTTAALLAILLQVSSVSNLGASFEKYCRGREMRGGGNNEPKTLGFQEVQAAKAQVKAQEKADEAKAKREAKIEKKAKKLVKEKKFKEPDAQATATQKQKAKEDAAALKKGESAAISQYKANKATVREQDKLAKANQERISFFEGIKQKFQSTLSPGALGGPLFGKLDLIFDSVKDVFYIIAVILTIAGVLSLPVLVFLIITYYVFKTMLSKFIIL